MNEYNEFKELTLNIVRILSKVSLNYHCGSVMNKSGHKFIETCKKLMN